MIKILQHSYWFCKDGGIETVLINWYRNMDRTKITMDFETMLDRKLNTDFVEEVRKNNNNFYAHHIHHDYDLLSRIPFYYSLFKHMRNNHYDIFQCHETARPLFLIPCWIAKLAGIKHICILSHSSLPPTKNFLDKVHNTRFQTIIKLLGAHQLAVSKVSGEPLFGTKNFQVVYNGIDTTKFSFSPTIRQQMRQKQNWNDKVVYGHVGRFVPAKNHSFLLEVFYHIRKHQPNAVLALIGHGELESKIRQQANQLGLKSHVEFLGIQPHLESFYSAFDAFIFPSIYEGLPMAGLEAQSAGLPCFFSQAVTDEIDICNTMFLPLSISAEKWAKIVLEKMKEFKRMDGSVTVKEAGFDIKDTVKNLERIYQNL